jgi:prepilin-type processing-associated H-X9-DG protein
LAVPNPAGVFACPSYRRVPAYFRNPLTTAGSTLGSYGYNRNGTGNAQTDPCLGLGGFIPATSPNRPEGLKPTRESAVTQPADLFMTGDSLLFPWAAGSVTTETYGGSDEFDHSLSNGVIWRELLKSATGGGSAFWSGSYKAIRRRHQGRFNTVLADAHVESLPIHKLSDPADSILRRWNIDNLPHSETISW